MGVGSGVGVSEPEGEPESDPERVIVTVRVCCTDAQQRKRAGAGEVQEAAHTMKHFSWSMRAAEHNPNAKRKQTGSEAQKPSHTPHRLRHSNINRGR